MAAFTTTILALALVGVTCALPSDVMAERSINYDQFYVNLRASLPGRPAVMSFTTTPTLYWGVSSSGSNFSYSGYELELWENSGTMVINTGLVSTYDQNMTVSASSALEHASVYSWRVRVHGIFGSSPTSSSHSEPFVGPWSNNHTFFTALASSWNAVPIWVSSSSEETFFAPSPPLADSSQYVFLRSSITATQLSIESAVIYISANVPVTPHPTQPPKILAGYKLWVGGDIVGMGPGRARCGPLPCHFGSPEQPYDGYDITEKAVKALSENGRMDLFVSGYGMKSSSIGPKIIAQVVIRYSNGSTVSYGTNPSTWQAMDATSIYSPTGQSGCSWYFYPCENFNASRMISGTPLSHDQENFQEPWQPASAMANFSIPLVAKPTAPINVSTRLAVELVDKGNGLWFFDLGRELQGGVVLSIKLPQHLANAPADQRTVTVTVAEELTGNQTIMFPPRTGINPRVVWTLAPTIEVQTITHHEYFEWRYGTLQFDGASDGGASCGDHVKEASIATISCSPGTITGFSFASFGNPNGGCDATPFAINQSCAAPDTIKVLNNECIGKTSCSIMINSSMAGPDPCHHVPKWLSWNATCSSTPTPPPTGITKSMINVSAWVVKMDYNYETAASMSTDNDVLDAVWELCRYTIESSSLDLYADSNARQRSADCVADDVTAMQSQYATSDELALQLYALEQMIAIGPASRTDWMVLPIIQVRNHILHTGELEYATENFDQLVLNYSNVNLISSKTGLVEGGSCLVDWPSGMQDHFVRSQTSTIASAFVYYGISALGDIATWIGRTEDAAKFAAMGASLKQAMNARQFNGSVFCDGQCDNITHTAFHASIHPLAFGAVDSNNMLSTWKYVKGRINPPFSSTPTKGKNNNNSTQPPRQTPWPPPEPSSGVGIPSGTHPAQFAVEALYMNENDRGSAALEVLTSSAQNSWVSMLKQGATMTMEMWNAEEKPNLTWSHPWASSPAFLIAWYLFGIQPTSPGFRSMAIKPAVGTLVKGSYSLPTIRGRVNVQFNQAGYQFDLKVTVPLGTKSDIKIPLPIELDSEVVEDATVSINGGSFESYKVKNGYVSIGTVLGGTHKFSLRAN